jgi:hypothetical protein
MPVKLHFVAQVGRGEELAKRLREHGFDNVNVVSDDHVVVAATPSEIRTYLDMPSEPETTAESPEGRVELPKDIEELVERVYRPLPPERFER